MFAYLIVVFLTTYLGYSISNNYILKYKIFYQLYDYINYYKLEVGYNQKKIKVITENYLHNCKKDYLNLNSFLNYLNIEYLSNDKFVYVDKIQSLNAREIQLIEEVLNNLGKYNIVLEMENIEILLNRVKQQVDGAYLNKNKYSNFYIKMGIIVGVFIDVLLI